MLWFDDETGLFEAYAYDLADRLLTHRTQDGVLTIFSYNSDNTLSARTAGSLREEFTWNALDQPKSAVRLDGGMPGSPLAFVYDGFSRLATEGQGAYDVLHTYDASHNPVTCKYPTGGPTLTYAFDELERMRSFHDGGPNLVDYEFAGPGRLHSRTTNHAIGSIAQSFTWDGLRRLTGMDAGAVHELTYAYDDFNRREFKQSHHAPLNGVGDVYDYDGGSRLSDIAYDAPSPPSSVGAASYLAILQSKVQARTQTTLTVGGPPVVTTWASDALHQTTDIGAVERFYDLKGNLTDDGEGLFYAYDAWNRLTSVSDSTGTLVTYELDALGRRSKRIEASGQTTRYVYSGARLLEESEASSPSGTFTLKIRYLYGAGLDELVALEDDVGARYFVFQDALGSVEAVTDWNGAVLERYRYDAFGQPTVTNGAGTVTHTDAVTGRPESPLGNSLWFTGARWDPESGNYHMRARQYEPKTGRFVSRDPLGYVDGPNAYAYGFSDPANWTDPMGLEAGGGGGSGPMMGSPMPASFTPQNERSAPVAGMIMDEQAGWRWPTAQERDSIIQSAYDRQFRMDNPNLYIWKGVGQTAGGVLEGAAAVGLAVAPVPGARVGAVVVGVNALDDLQAGVRILMGDESAATLKYYATYEGLKAAGVDDESARTAAIASEIGFGLVAGGVGWAGGRGFLVRAPKIGAACDAAKGGLGALGRAGKGKGIREVVGDSGDARKLFDALRGSNPVTEVKPGVFTAPGANGGTVTFRGTSKSGPPTVDVHGIEDGIRKIKFVNQ